MTWRSSFSALQRMAWVAAIVIASLSVTGAPAQVGPQLSAHDLAKLPPTRPDAQPDIWDMQDGLIARSIARIPAASGHPNIYAVAIDPLARQKLFSREAKVALQDFAANYGGTAGSGVLLSNSPDDMTDAPLATRQNIADVLGRIGSMTRSSPDDVVVIYLVSHGGPDASLETGMSGGMGILAITADSMAAAINRAQIGRRVIIISACFSGSWIPKLADDNAIIITAAQADRTSFGCAENRPLTYFGEAFLHGPFAQGASLHDSYEGAKKTVTQQESDEKLLNSNPQFYVGKNMQAFWDTASKPQPAMQRTAAARP